MPDIYCMFEDLDLDGNRCHKAATEASKHSKKPLCERHEYFERAGDNYIGVPGRGERAYARAARRLLEERAVAFQEPQVQRAPMIWDMHQQMWVPAPLPQPVENNVEHVFNWDEARWEPARAVPVGPEAPGPF